MKKEISTWDFQRALAAPHNSENFFPVRFCKQGIFIGHHGGAKTVTSRQYKQQQGFSRCRSWFLSVLI